MYPELFRIGDFPITAYGLWLAGGMLIALYAASRLATRDGLPRDRIYDLGLWTLLGGLLGSKILMFFVDPNVSLFSFAATTCCRAVSTATCAAASCCWVCARLF
ncbi:prolipoprotein diacylglyceryl transferase family protein [Leptolyngbya sp. 7M]|uniref:prolipoprotein diacylglyceryl transferase family protein n=1 Tax=Leptolyngbya sp. 7M TaxID=2812896 RepID=UPI001B8C49EA|nr:prolipoprotein diacylglyceryl transferase [Leptolyngbya sp. 7M]